MCVCVSIELIAKYSSGKTSFQFKFLLVHLIAKSLAAKHKQCLMTRGTATFHSAPLSFDNRTPPMLSRDILMPTWWKFSEFRHCLPTFSTGKVLPFIKNQRLDPDLHSILVSPAAKESKEPSKSKNRRCLRSRSRSCRCPNKTLTPPSSSWGRTSSRRSLAPRPSTSAPWDTGEPTPGPTF